jgi:hypothetical protein
MNNVYSINTGRKVEDDCDRIPDHKGEYLFHSMLEAYIKHNEYLKGMIDLQAVFNTSGVDIRYANFQDVQK